MRQIGTFEVLEAYVTGQLHAVTRDIRSPWADNVHPNRLPLADSALGVLSNRLLQPVASLTHERAHLVEQS